MPIPCFYIQTCLTAIFQVQLGQPVAPLSFFLHLFQTRASSQDRPNFFHIPLNIIHPRLPLASPLSHPCLHHCTIFDAISIIFTFNTAISSEYAFPNHNANCKLVFNYQSHHFSELYIFFLSFFQSKSHIHCSITLPADDTTNCSTHTRTN